MAVSGEGSAADVAVAVARPLHAVGCGSLSLRIIEVTDNQRGQAGRDAPLLDGCANTGGRSGTCSDRWSANTLVGYHRLTNVYPRFGGDESRRRE